MQTLTRSPWRVRWHGGVTAQPTSGDVFEALANPRRREILTLLAGSPRSLREIARELPITRQAVSGHLRYLSSAGLVVDELAGARRQYRLNESGQAAVRDYLDHVFGPDNRHQCGEATERES
jgi:DNA-binding transcriptional ArsR family regulator